MNLLVVTPFVSRTLQATEVFQGCTGVCGVAEQATQGLAQYGQSIPVIAPVDMGILQAERLGLGHSKRTYPAPRSKPVRGYDFVPSIG